MLLEIGILLLVFFLGELIFNYTVFKYLKSYFPPEETQPDAKPFLWLNISTFKGLLERFVLFVALFMNIPQILIVFGAIKIGSRFDKNHKVRNDYFIIGNFFSVLISIFYLFCSKILLRT